MATMGRRSPSRTGNVRVASTSVADGPGNLSVASAIAVVAPAIAADGHAIAIVRRPGTRSLPRMAPMQLEKSRTCRVVNAQNGDFENRAREAAISGGAAPDRAAGRWSVVGGR